MSETRSRGVEASRSLQTSSSASRLHGTSALAGSGVAQRFCLDLTHHFWTRAKDARAAVERTFELARIADEAGIDSVWVSEDPDGWDAFGVLGALARETERVRLGTGVTNPYLRHPNLIASSVATLDRISRGRAFLGLGRGQTEWYEQALGLEVGKPVEVLEETFELLRQWWEAPNRASASSAGAHFRVRDWERTVHPLQLRPPMYLAAVGPKALRVAGRHADGVLFNDLASEEFLRDAIGRVRDEATAVGRDSGRLAFLLRGRVTATDRPEPVLERKKAYIALVNTLPGMERLMMTPRFDVPSIMAEVRRHMKTEEILAGGGAFPDMRKEGDLAAAKEAIPTELVAELALVGTLADIRAKLRRLFDIGVTHVFVAPPRYGDTAQAFAQQLTDLSTDR